MSAMRALKTKVFVRWARHEKVPDKALLTALDEMRRGLMGVNLGGHVYKKRVALAGRGKSGGARALIVYRESGAVFFARGFAKNERDNIGIEELTALKKLAKKLLNYSGRELNDLVAIGELIEVKHHERHS